MKKSIKFLPLLSMGLVVVGCQDYDAGFTESDIKAKQYANDFQKTFGNVDPNQDWSMASSVKVNFMIGNNPVAEFYTGKPGYAGTRFVGLAKDNIKNIAVVTGTNQVYAVVTENGKQLVAGYFDVIDGVVNVSDKPVAKMAAGQTRADGEEPASPALGTKLFTHIAYTEKSWDGETYVFAINDTYKEALLRLAKEGDNYYVYFAPNKTTTPRKLKYNWTPNEYCGPGVSWHGIEGMYDTGEPLYYEDDNSLAIEEGIAWANVFEYVGEELVFKSGATAFYAPKHYNAPYYRISGNTKTDDAEWVIGDCDELFWNDDACFLESEDFRCSRKQAVYSKYGASVEDLQKGVEFTTVKNDQQINIPMMYGATSKSNILGYYYYTNDQDPRAVNRYVLFDDARPTTNIKVDGTAINDGMRMQSKGNWTDDLVVTCTTRRLVYFGPEGKGIDGNGKGTFNFPKDVHIGFFISSNLGADNNWSSLDDPLHPQSLASWAYSMPSLNQKYLYNSSGELDGTLQMSWSYRYASPQWTDLDNTSNPYGTPNVDGRVKAITWQYGDKILVGFGDDSGDEDLNDFVFWYDSEVKEDEKPKINITTTEETLTTNWLIACEDLGGTFDYDFNDVVWEFKSGWKRKTVIETEEDSDGNMTGMGSVSWNAYGSISLLAAGGTLPAELIYDGTNFGEVHQLFGQEPADVYDIVNARSITEQPVLLKTFTVDEATALFSEDDYRVLIMSVFEKFKVMVTDANGVTHYVDAPSISAPSTGDDNTPEMILLPYNWEWPTENTFILDAYPNFKSWVNSKTWEDWSTVKVSGKTVSRN